MGYGDNYDCGGYSVCISLCKGKLPQPIGQPGLQSFTGYNTQQNTDEGNAYLDRGKESIWFMRKVERFTGRFAALVGLGFQAGLACRDQRDLCHGKNAVQQDQ